MRRKGGRYTPPKPRPLLSQGLPFDFVILDVADLDPDLPLIEAMRQACPCCNPEGIHHPGPDSDEAEKSTDPPLATEGRLATTPGTSRRTADGHQGTH